MLRLVAFELKKMLSSRIALLTNVLMTVFLICAMFANVFQTIAENAQGEVLKGMAAIEFNKQQADAFAGDLTVDRVAQDIAAYQQMAYEKVSFEELSAMSAEAAYAFMRETYGQQQFALLYDPYYITILSPWYVQGLEPYQYAGSVTAEDAAGFYDAIRSKIQQRLDLGLNKTWPYSAAEHDFWTAKQAQVEEPLAYGYAGGWVNVIECYGFLLFAMLAICITLVPVFANEYRNGTDAVLLSAKNGTSRLAVAKLAASFLYLTGYFALNAAIMLGILLVCHGADGFSLPVQVLTLNVPYDLTIGQCALVAIGLMYVVTLGVAALTLGLSARTPSVLAIMVVDIMVIFVAEWLPTMGSGVLFRILQLFPSSLQSPGTMLTSMVSYPLGPVVIDAPTMALAVYALMFAVAVPCAIRAWQCHQVR